jgi:hypothetical protein
MENLNEEDCRSCFRSCADRIARGCQLKDEKPVSKSAAPVAEKVVKKEVKKSEKEVTLEALSGEVRSLRFRVKRLEDVARAHGLAQ